MAEQIDQLLYRILRLCSKYATMARIHLSIRINKTLRSGGHGRYLEKFRL